MSTSTDPTLTIEKVTEVMEKVKVDKRRQVWGRVLTWRWESPADQLYSSHSTEKEKNLSCSDTYVNCHPEASWDHLTSLLYEEDEMTAVDQARPFLPPKGWWCGEKTIPSYVIIKNTYLFPQTSLSPQTDSRFSLN